MKHEGGDIERLADFVTVMRQQPHSVREVAERLHVSQSSVRLWLRVFRDKGHIQEAAPVKYKNMWASRWVWV